MTLDQFIGKWLGGKTDQDGVWGYQCVDLIKAYVKEVYPRVTAGAWGDALDYWRDTNHPLLKWYDRVASQSPQRGDIVIFKTYGRTDLAGAGHIAIAVNSDTMLEQNGATGDGDGMGGDEIRYRTIPKSRIAGLLRPKEGGQIMDTEDGRQLYVVALHRPAENAGVAGQWNGLKFSEAAKRLQNSPEWLSTNHKAIFYDRDVGALRQQLEEVKQALANEQAKPPVEIIKEVEKIVEKPVEVIKEVPVVVGEDEAVRSFFGRIIDKLIDLFKKK